MFALNNITSREMSTPVSIQVSQNTYLKNPETSDLGIKIISGSIDLLDELGFEQFTFKKLATYIGSTEASIYRYFESKNQILVYLTSWYWSWIDYQLLLCTLNIESPEKKLENSINLLTKIVEQDSDFSFVDEVKLNRIINADSSKIYLNKNVDLDNSYGYFAPYKKVVQMVCDIILEINPNYKYPHMLISTMIEGAHHQRFFAEHLPRLTDVIKGEDSVTEFYLDMVFKSIEQ
jgi:AcrR family transcriptional regulator|tara:strand:+ start:112848 stop:113549 length:702 start_codon:yes stop_codon:yes gene_type:complete